MDCFWGFGLTGSQLGVSGSGCHLLFCLSGWKELVEGLDVEELANGFRSCNEAVQLQGSLNNHKEGRRGHRGVEYLKLVGCQPVYLPELLAAIQESKARLAVVEGWEVMRF